MSRVFSPRIEGRIRAKAEREHKSEAWKMTKRYGKLRPEPARGPGGTLAIDQVWVVDTGYTFHIEWCKALEGASMWRVVVVSTAGVGKRQLCKWCAGGEDEELELELEDDVPMALEPEPIPQQPALLPKPAWGKAQKFPTPHKV
jgi:hypothetical protein